MSNSSRSRSGRASKHSVIMPDLTDPSSFQRVDPLDLDTVYAKVAQIDDEDEKNQSIIYLLHSHPTYLDKLDLSRLNNLQVGFGMSKTKGVANTRASILEHVNASVGRSSSKKKKSKQPPTPTKSPAKTHASSKQPKTSRFGALFNKLKLNSTLFKHPLHRSKPHALFDRVRGQHSADDDYEHEGDHDADNGDLQLQEADEDDDTDTASTASTAHTLTPTKPRRTASASASAASSASATALSTATEISLANELIGHIARNNPAALAQLTVPTGKTSASTATTHQSTSVRGPNKQPTGTIRVLTAPTPVPSHSVPTFAAAMEGRMPTLATATQRQPISLAAYLGGGGGLNVHDFASDDSTASLPDREARGILIDSTRLSAYIIEQTPGGLAEWVRKQHFKENRNFKECIQWAQVIDALVADKVVDIHTSEPLERAVRRLMGVHTADKSKKWSMCDALELQDTCTTLLPPLIFDRTVKRAAQLEKLNDNSRNAYNNNDNFYANNQGGRQRKAPNKQQQRHYDNNNNARPAQANDRPRYNKNNNNRGQHVAADQVGAQH
jgi:hypothetical protein